MQQKGYSPRGIKFGERADTGKAYDFKEEVEWLPFQFNLGDVPSPKNKKD